MSSQNSIDIPFTLPLTQRLRFTQDLFGLSGTDRKTKQPMPDESTPEKPTAGFDVLLDLLESAAGQDARVQVWIDADVLAANPGLDSSLSANLQNPENRKSGNGKAHTNVVLTKPPVSIPGGEECKNDPKIVDRLLQSFNDCNLDRRSYVIVIGGGAVLDVVGYAAAVAHRGIRLIRIPTTTLAQADSGVGVKNAVNWFNKKNWKGTFAVPWAVINDAAILNTLPDRDFHCGFSEVVKVSLLKKPEVFERVCELADSIRQREPEACDFAIRESVIMHIDHITKGGDPFEMLEARPLDFGHWSAHRIEAITNYQVRHGEAVAIGLAIDCVYSSRVLGLSEPDTHAILECLKRLGLPRRHECLRDPTILLSGLEEFRQHLGGRLTVTLLQGIGSPIDVHEIDDRAMREAICTVEALDR